MARIEDTLFSRLEARRARLEERKQREYAAGLELARASERQRGYEHDQAEKEQAFARAMGSARGFQDQGPSGLGYVGDRASEYENLGLIEGSNTNLGVQKASEAAAAKQAEKMLLEQFRQDEMNKRRKAQDEAAYERVKLMATEATKRVGMGQKIGAGKQAHKDKMRIVELLLKGSNAAGRDAANGILRSYNPGSPWVQATAKAMKSGAKEDRQAALALLSQEGDIQEALAAMSEQGIDFLGYGKQPESTEIPAGETTPFDIGASDYTGGYPTQEPEPSEQELDPVQESLRRILAEQARKRGAQ
jgi:hypothetical protein